MNKRKFVKKATKGVLGVQQSLRYLYVAGSHLASQPNHTVVRILVEKGYITKDRDNVLTLTDKGVAYVAKQYPKLKRYEENDERTSSTV